MPNVILNYFEESSIKNKYLPAEWQEQNSLDELAEFLQYNWEQRSIFYDDEKSSGKQQFVGFSGKKGLRTNNYIGTIVFRGQQLNIFPKVFREDKNDNDADELELSHLMRNLVQWLKYCKRISYPFISISSELEDINDLRELFITLYLHYVIKAINNVPYHQYVEKSEDIETIKGCIDFRDYINKKIPYGQNHKFLCSFSEFEYDNIVNRIIKYTCRTLTNIDTSTNNKKLIRQILIRLNEVSDIHCSPSDCDGIRLSKLHRQYSDIMSMSKILLLNQTPSYRIDNHNSFCFLFPTEYLFEGFVSGYMREILDGKANVKIQASELSLINDVIYKGQSLGEAFRMKHDILVAHKELGLFVLDTKYKHLSRFDGNSSIKKIIADEIEQGDLYQVIEYAAHRDLNDAYLLYPMYRYEEKEPEHVILERCSVSGKKLSVHIVRLPFIFEENYEITYKSLKESILQIFAEKT